MYLRTTRHKTRVVLDRRSYRFAVGKEGIGARVLHMPTIKPFDAEAVARAAGETKGIVTMENHSVIGGLGGAVAEVFAERGAGGH